MPIRDPLQIVMLSAEAAPFAKVGGLGDVVGALPQVLERLSASLRLIIPDYGVIQHERFGIRPFEPIPDFSVPMGPGYARAQVYHTMLPSTGVDVLFIGSNEYFSRDGIYDDPATGEGYPDNMERFIFFVKAGLEAIRRWERQVDIIHCHDAQTGLIPGLLQTNSNSDPFFSRTGTLFTIHNLAYQGLYGKEALYWSGIDYRYFYPGSPFEFWGKVNFMKVGIACADLVNTVSQTYALEIQSSPEYGYGLEGVLKERKDDLTGIVNGIDYAEWNPETDSLIPANFSAADLSGKEVCKSHLLASYGLPRSQARIPLVGIVSRLADQKGFDLIASALDELARLDLQMVILGTGQPKYHIMLQKIAGSYPDTVGVRLGFDNTLAHQIEAGADMFLMPSKYEPCGLNQLYSLRYGTIPIVRATGGLADTVQNYDIGADTGTGFSFKNYTAADMIIALKRALLVYEDPSRWQSLMLRAMAQNWSWEESARKYMRLYERIYRKRNQNEPS